MKVKVALLVIKGEERSTIFNPIEISQTEKQRLAIANIHFGQLLSINSKILPQFTLQTADIVVDPSVRIRGEPPIPILKVNKGVLTVGLGLGRYDLPHREQQARIREALEFMNLTADGGRLVSEYSGGMVRRLEIAQSTLHRPRVLFLDEPTVGLDPIARDAVWKHLIDLRANYGTTLFFTTHYLEEAESHCDRIAIMHLGKLVALGTCKELESSLGSGHTLNDVFAHYAGTALDSGGTFRDVSTERATAQRLG